MTFQLHVGEVRMSDIIQCGTRGWNDVVEFYIVVGGILVKVHRHRGVAQDDRFSDLIPKIYELRDRKAVNYKASVRE